MPTTTYNPTQEHYTPPKFVEAARQLMGNIDLDPASCEIANRLIVGADEYYTVADDGLSKQWHGRVILNPPGGKTFNRSNQAIWFQYLYDEWIAKRTISATYFSFNLEIFCHIPHTLRFPRCILKDRIRFWSYDTRTEMVREGQWSEAKGKWTNAPKYPSAVIYLPPHHKVADWSRIDDHQNCTNLVDVFGEFGWVPGIDRGLPFDFRYY